MPSYSQKMLTMAKLDLTAAIGPKDAIMGAFFLSESYHLIPDFGLPVNHGNKTIDMSCTENAARRCFDHFIGDAPIFTAQAARAVKSVLNV